MEREGAIDSRLHARKPYDTPRLEEHGDIRAITHELRGTAAEFLAGPDQLGEPWGTEGVS